uniref:ribosomal protein S16 n=1 Tax=Tsunamia transpacifica TaxID=1935457 RepID=UPI001BEED656|nr:ribosomal protein S16 [Tsunamia transpacifica]QUE27941.1 ribosomal protein S16 [Tsunamia transpacifica]UNJ14456.1 ribosomal protein S16 [Tsunamia transpacifica]
MIRIRMKCFGRKKQKTYRIVIMYSKTRRDGKVIEEVGFFNPITQETRLNLSRIKERLAQGAQPTNTVKNLLRKSQVI